MFDRLSIRLNTGTITGSRFLREAHDGVYQTVFFEGQWRVDPVAYPCFAADPVMDAAADRMLRELAADADRRAAASDRRARHRLT